jgi:uncharacterized protein YndB with AHSA1/START domain
MSKADHDSDPDRIEKQIELRAPRSRVWRAITDPAEFGTWFGLGEPLELVGRFEPGATIIGKWRSGGVETVEPFCTIEAVEPEERLVFRWVPYELPPGEDHAKHPHTRIEFRLADAGDGTRLTVSESGFAALPADKRYKRDQNAQGWGMQLQAIAQHLLGRVDVRVETRIARPPAEVFDAIVDPARMDRYFFTSTGRIAPGAKLEWEMVGVGPRHAVQVMHVEPGKRIVFVWSASGVPTKVTLALADDDGDTHLECLEAPFALTRPDVARALQQTRGWSYFCACLRAYLEHGIDLRPGKRARDVA